MSDLAGEMGGLQLSTGSHWGGVYEFRPALGAGGMEVTDKLEGDWVHNPVEQGDVLFFHSLMVHKGVANRSNRLRLSMDARFQRVDQPIAPGSLEPHGREVRNWEQVYADWPPGSRLKYYWRQYPLKVQPFDPSYFEKRDRMGLEMGAAGDPRAPLGPATHRRPGRRSGQTRPGSQPAGPIGAKRRQLIRTVLKGPDVAAPQSGGPASTPHRISLRLSARLLRVPLKGGVRRHLLGARASRPHAVPYGGR